MTNQERVQAGVAYLDRKMPEVIKRAQAPLINWREAFIDFPLEKLDINNTFNCVLGVIAKKLRVANLRDFFDLSTILVLEWEDAIQLGLADTGDKTEDLTEAWREYLRPYTIRRFTYEVEQGVKFLNRTYHLWAEEASAIPEHFDWVEAFRDIDYHSSDVFYLNDIHTCVLGILAKWAGFQSQSYYDMKQNLNVFEPEVGEYGFCVTYGMAHKIWNEDDDISYSTLGDELTQAWIAKLDELLAN